MSNLMLKAYVWMQAKRMDMAEARAERGEEGQGVVEYALVLGVIVVALFLAFTYTDIITELGAALGDLVSIFQDGEL